MIECNLNNNAISQTLRRYSSMCHFNGRTLCTRDDGLFQLYGYTDSGEQIEAWIKSGKFDLGTERYKRIRFFYFGLNAQGNIKLSLFADDQPAGEYEVFVQGRQEVRVPVSRAFEARYWQWKVENMDGAFFALYSVKVLPVAVHSGQRR